MPALEVLCAAILAVGIGGDKKSGEFACQQLPDISRAAAANNLEPELIIALIHHESRFRPHVVSRANACGLMQVIPRFTGNRKGGVNRGTGVPKLSCKDLKDPAINIKYGTMTLRYWIYGYARGNKRIGLCGYNAGFRCKGKAPHVSGMSYSRKVLRTYRRLQRKVKALTVE